MTQWELAKGTYGQGKGQWYLPDYSEYYYPHFGKGDAKNGGGGKGKGKGKGKGHAESSQQVDKLQKTIASLKEQLTKSQNLSLIHI